MAQFSAHALDLVQAALLTSFWRHDALKRFLRRQGVSEGALSHLTKDLTKRQFLDQLFPKLEAHASGPALLRRMAKELSEQQSFPDLDGWEDSGLKKETAQLRVAELREYLAREEAAHKDETERARIREKAAQNRAREQSHVFRLNDLKRRLENDLLPGLGTAPGGYAFQDWFADLMTLFEIPCKRPYKTPEGREVDGSVSTGGMTYLLSLKFTRNPSEPSDVSDFRGRLTKVADYTMGIVVSMSGFTSGAIKDASGGGTSVILFDHQHLYYVLQGLASFPEVVTRVREHASRTGEAFLSVADFGK
jgi:hypothetical protein